MPLSHATPRDDAYWSNYPLSTIIQESAETSYVYLPGRNGLSVYDLAQNTLLSPSSIYQTLQQPFLNPESGVFTAAPNPGLETNNFTITLLETNGKGLSQTAQYSPSLNRGLIGSPASDIIQLDGTSDRIRVSSETFEAGFYSADGFRSAQIQGYVSFLANDGSVTTTTPDGSFLGSVMMPGSAFGKVHIGLLESPDGSFRTYVLSGNEIFLLDETSGGDLRPRPIHSSNSIGWPALVDIDRSGKIDFIFVDEGSNQLLAKNINGAVLSGFPIEAPPGSVFKGTPLISDLDGDDVPDILIAARTSESLNIYAYSADGNPIDGFPLLAGSYPDASNDIINPALNGKFLAAVSPGGDFRVWLFPNAKTTLWESRYGNGGTNKLTGRLPDADTQEEMFSLLNKQETYNWPNPASDETYIRFQTSDPGSVKIRISTTSGRLIYNQTHESRGGSPEEILIDTSGWGSGGYLALVEATVNGDTERKLVKIAVAR